MRLAITGGTGFVGSHLLDRALAAGHEMNALTRREQPVRTGVHWIPGALDDRRSLERLATGCDAIVHVAGVINGSREDFARGNIAGTQSMIAAAAQAGIQRFIHISSLAAREPGLSAYGWSKCVSEEPVIAGADGWTVIRPPAIYGPRDRELLELFRAARRHIVPLPRTRLSVIAVEDLCDLILACLRDGASIGRTFEPDDDRPGGWPAAELARAIGKAVDRRVVTLPLPRAALLLGARADRLVRGRRAKLTPDRVNYFTHPDWTARMAARPPAALWQPRIDTATGLADTARWYREAGWL